MKSLHTAGKSTGLVYCFLVLCFNGPINEDLIGRDLNRLLSCSTIAFSSELTYISGIKNELLKVLLSTNLEKSRADIKNAQKKIPTRN